MTTNGVDLCASVPTVIVAPWQVSAHPAAALPPRLRGVNRLGGAAFSTADSAPASGAFWPPTISEETSSMASSPTNSQRSSFDLSGAVAQHQRASFDMSPPLGGEQNPQYQQDYGAGGRAGSPSPGPPAVGAGLPRRSLDTRQAGGGAANGAASELRRASVDNPGGIRGTGAGSSGRPSVEEPAPLRILIAEDNSVRRSSCCAALPQRAACRPSCAAILQQGSHCRQDLADCG